MSHIITPEVLIEELNASDLVISCDRLEKTVPGFMARRHLVLLDHGIVSCVDKPKGLFELIIKPTVGDFPDMSVEKSCRYDSMIEAFEEWFAVNSLVLRLLGVSSKRVMEELNVPLRLPVSEDEEWLLRAPFRLSPRMTYYPKLEVTQKHQESIHADAVNSRS